jgi:hypothetical protein
MRSINKIADDRAAVEPSLREAAGAVNDSCAGGHAGV